MGLFDEEINSFNLMNKLKLFNIDLTNKKEFDPNKIKYGDEKDLYDQIEIIEKVSSLK